LREVLVIALGILLAFAVDASWDAVRERGQLDSHLDAVTAELEQNLRALRELEDASRRVFRASAALVTMSGPDAVAERPDSVNQLIVTLWSPPTATFSRGALEALRSSGLLAEVRDPELRAALATWPDRVEDPLAVLGLANRRFQEVASPMLHTYVSEVDLNRADPFFKDTELPELLPPSRFPADHTALLRDRSLASLMSQRAALALIAADLSVEVQQEASRMGLLLERH
jgi:hypothetical protein